VSSISTPGYSVMASKAGSWIVWPRAPLVVPTWNQGAVIVRGHRWVGVSEALLTPTTSIQPVSSVAEAVAVTPAITPGENEPVTLRTLSQPLDGMGLPAPVTVPPVRKAMTHSSSACAVPRMMVVPLAGTVPEPELNGINRTFAPVIVIEPPKGVDPSMLPTGPVDLEVLGP
jgi:hypothetical protein